MALFYTRFNIGKETKLLDITSFIYCGAVMLAKRFVSDTNFVFL